MVIRSDELARQAIDLFSMATLPENSYRLELENNKRLVWYSQDSGIDRRYHSEPDASIWKKILVSLISLLPVESLL